VGSDYQRQQIKNPILGIVQNLPPESIDPRAFITAHNVVFRNGQVQKVAGWVRNVTSAVGSVNYIDLIRVNGTETITIIGTNLNLYKFDSTTLAALNVGFNFQMSPNARWTADFMINRWFFTNQQDGLWVWSGSAIQPVFDAKYGQAGLGYAYDVPINAAADVSQFQNHIILGNIATGDAAGALTWAGSSLSGQDGSFNFVTSPPPIGGVPQQTDSLVAEISDNASAIQASMRIGSQLVFYKEDSIHLLSYQGGIYVYSLTQQESYLGVKSPGAVVDLGDSHVYISADNIYKFNGSSNQAIGDRVWQFLINDVYPNSITDIRVFLDQRFREVYFHYKSKGGIKADGTYDKTLIWNYEYDSFSTRDFPFSAIGYTVPGTNIMDQPIGSLGGSISSMTGTIAGSDPALQGLELVGGDEGGNISIISDSNVLTANGAPITSILETGDMNFGGADKLKILGGLDIDCPVNTTPLAGDLPLQVYVAPQWTLGGALTWEGPYTLEPGWRGVNFTAQAPWFRFRFVKVGGDFQLRGWSPRFQIRGNY